MRKAMGSKGTESMERMAWLAVEIVLLVFATAALIKIMVALYNPDKQISYYNAEKLAAKMDEACLNEQAFTLDRFTMSQPSPSKLWGISDIIPKTSINIGGDPNYVVYYESFPPGEAIGWEVYESMNYRIIAPLIGPEQMTKDDVAEFIKKVKSDATQEIRAIEDSLPDDQKTGVVEPDVIIPNIILDDEKKGKILEKTENFPGTIGDWEAKVEGEDYYIFNTYLVSGPLQKTTVKYRACGVNALCLKTKEGIYRFPLEHCKGKVDYVELNYVARDADLEDILGPAGGIAAVRAGPGIAALLQKIPSLWTKILGIAGKKMIPFVGWTIAIGDAWKAGIKIVAGYKVSDFYIASPCDISRPTVTGMGDGAVTIEYLPGTDVNGDGSIDMDEACICKRTFTYPLYEYNEITDVLTKVSEKKICLDSNGGGDIIDESNLVKEEKIPCLRVEMKHSARKKDFCWTSSPTTLSYHDSWLQVADPLTDAAGYIGGRPVTKSTDFIPENNIIIIKPTGSGTPIDKYRDSFWNNLGKGWSWQWPAGV
ncbi:MAG: hypothetical protein HZB67_00805 [Candidatus Aenigmarchaeota archaeon]|nr:hypothetical protein [Candidatus Aenigmarchaeota archaeon]